MHRILAGTAAGAVGATAINVTTYADMMVRGRSASRVPAELAGKLASSVGLDLAPGAPDKAANRKEALGSLLGYGQGLWLGAAYGLARPLLGGISPILAGAALGLVTMVASDVPVAVSGISRPSQWTASDWLADLVPHLVYGVVTALAFEAAFRDRSRGQAAGRWLGRALRGARSVFG
jgi:hypothetical protein